RQFHALLIRGMRDKWLTIAITFGVFTASVVGMGFVEQQFFPTSDRTEIIVDVTERANASIAKTDEDRAKIEAILSDASDALFWMTYVDRGAPRFVMSMDVTTPGPYMGQIVIQTPDLAARDRLKARLVEFTGRELIRTDVYVKNLEIGPPVGK